MKQADAVRGVTAAEPAPAPVVRRRAPRASGALIWGLRIGLLAVVLAVWELLAATRLIDPFFVSRPSAVFGQLYAWIADASIFAHVVTTLWEAAVGLAISSVLGVGLGLGLARYPVADSVTRPFIDVLNTIPRFALAPLFVLWFGLGIKAKIVLVVSVATFAFLINTYSGAKSIDPEHVKLARSLGVSRLETMRVVVLPSIVPWLLAGTRLAVAYSLAAAVVGEIVSSQVGLGYLIAFAAGVLDTKGEFAALIALAIVAYVINTAVAQAERRLLRWKTLEAGSAGSGGWSRGAD